MQILRIMTSSRPLRQSELDSIIQVFMEAEKNATEAKQCVFDDFKLLQLMKLQLGRCKK